jgi:hypothetical protein
MASNDMDRVVPLGQLDDFRVAEGDPDVRGWEVLASDGRKIGEVDELLVDTGAMKVRYLDVDLDGEDVVLSGGPDRHVLIPIGYARLERDRDCVMVEGLASSELAGLPSYGQGPLTRDFETSVRESFATRGRGGGVISGGRMHADDAPGTGAGMGMPGTPLADSPPPMRAAGSDVDAGTSGPMRAAPGGHTLGSGGDRIGAGSRGPAGGVEREQVRGDASHGTGLAGSDYQHNADEDFYASDAFDDARFYGARRGMGPESTAGMRGSPNDAAGGTPGLGTGPSDADEVDQLSGSGLEHGGDRGSTDTGDTGVSRDQTDRLARDAAERLRQDHQNRDVGGGGSV